MVESLGRWVAQLVQETVSILARDLGDSGSSRGDVDPHPFPGLVVQAGILDFEEPSFERDEILIVPKKLDYPDRFLQPGNPLCGGWPGITAGRFVDRPYFAQPTHNR